MNWTDLLWLAAGVGVGVGSKLFFLSRRNQPLIPGEVASFDQSDPVAQVEALTVREQCQPDALTLKAQLQQTELAYQMASEMSQFKGGFLARTAHELRSPLNGLIGMHQLILSDLCDSPAEEREFIAEANACALKMVKILDEIIDVAKADYGTKQLQIQPVQLASLLQEVYTLTHLQAQDRNLQLTIPLPKPDLYVLSDPRRLRQVLVHLINTAILQAEEGSIRLSVQPSSVPNYICIWLDDNRPSEAWSESINLLQSNVFPAQDSSPIDQFAAEVQRSSAIALRNTLASNTVLSPGLNLLLDQTLLELMQGRLEILQIPSSNPETLDQLDASGLKTRLQCSLPLVVPEDIGVDEGCLTAQES